MLIALTQGKVMLDPTVLAQTLHGHSGTITSLVVYADIILSSSTDGTVRSWRAVEGREQLLYPWFDLQVRGQLLLACHQ